MAHDLALKSGFLQEALELLDGCEFFSILERTGVPDPSALECAQRMVHNLKGTAKAVGFSEYATFAQEVEALLTRVRSAEFRPEAIRALTASHHHLRAMTLALLEDMETSFPGGELFRELRRLNEAIPHEEEVTLTDAELGTLLALETARRLGNADAGQATFAAALEKLRLVAAETARGLNKEIRFEAFGDQIAVPEEILSALTDPLLHLVRNAIDHGIEPVAERKRIGKPSCGRISVRITREDEKLILECQDDGRGIDPRQTVRKAREKGFLKSWPADREPDRTEAVRLIFLPGFSTRDEVTALSGRGIGMDIVRENIERIQGRIEVDSRVGQGCVFRIELPLRGIIDKSAAA